MRTFILVFIFFTLLNSSSLRQFECNDLYIDTNKQEILDEFGAFAIPKVTLNVKLSNFSYNVLDNFIYAMVVDPINLKGWSRYDIVKIDKDGKVVNLGTPLFKNGDNVYDAFRVANATIDEYGYYYSLGDPISIDPRHSKRAILYIVYLGNNPKAGSLRFDKKSLKLLNFYEWENPTAIAYLRDRLYAINKKDIFEIDIKNLTIKKLEILNKELIQNLDIKNIWTKDKELFLYASSKNQSFILKAKPKQDTIKLKRVKSVNLYGNFKITSCIAPTLTQSSSKKSVSIGDSFYYEFEIKNPFSYPIKVEFDTKLSDGASFDSFEEDIKSTNYYFSPDEVRIEDLLIPKLSNLKLKFKIDIENSLDSKIEVNSFIIFRGIKIFPESTKASNIVLDTPSITLKERLLKNKDEDKSKDISVGDSLIFEVIATNSGKVNLYDVRVGDPTLTPDSTFCQLLKPKESCILKGLFKVKREDETRRKILTQANVVAKNLPKKYLSLNIPINSDSVDLDIKLLIPNNKIVVSKDIESKIKITNRASIMATGVEVSLTAPKQCKISPKREWKIPFIDGDSSYELPFKIKCEEEGLYKIKAKVKSEDRDLYLKNNEKSIELLAQIPKAKMQIVDIKLKKESKKVRNTPPIAKDDEITIPINQTTIADISQGVLVNDKDLDGDALKVISFKVDSNGDGVDEVYHPKDLVDISGVGYFTLFEDGSFKFELQDGYNGYIPTVTYIISDGKGGTSSAELILSIGDKFSIKKESKIQPISLGQDVEIQDGEIGFYLFISFIFLFLRRAFASKHRS